MKKKGFTHESTYNESQEWYTPRWIFEMLRLSFDLDPCSPGAGVVPWIPAKRHFTFLENGLMKDWGDSLVFVNPPYGMDTPAWMRKFAIHGNGIGLVFSRTDTGWFHDYAMQADCLLFIKGRIKFVQSEQAPAYSKGIEPKGAGCGAGSLLIAFGSAASDALMKCGKQGAILRPCAGSRKMETVVTDGASQVAATVANENLPRFSQTAQGRLF